MNYNELKTFINTKSIDETLHLVSCLDDLNNEKSRYLSILDSAFSIFKDGDYHIISSPGRTEIGGNHTDHQHGHVLAAAVNIDNVCACKTNDENIVRFKDKAFNIAEIDLNNLDINVKEYNTSESLIKGVAFKLKEMGYIIGGFDCYCDSKVLVGSGISSSACFEVMIGQIFNTLYNNNSISKKELAIIGMFAENEYFGKPSGLLDQMTIAQGGFVAINFKDPNNPEIESYDFSFSDYGYDLLLINTKGDHADLSHEYAAIPNEIKEVSKCLNVEYLADSSYDKLIDNFNSIRDTVKNDRSILRSMHFFKEDKRAILQKEAVRNKDINKLIELINNSGRSSYMYLQNVYPASRPNSQALALALCLTDNFLEEKGAFRVHGGGFDGTIQVIIPSNMTKDYLKLIEPIFGQDCVLFIKTRPVGTFTVI